MPLMEPSGMLFSLRTSVIRKFTGHAFPRDLRNR